MVDIPETNKVKELPNGWPPTTGVELVPPPSNGFEYTNSDLLARWNTIPVGDPAGYNYVADVYKSLTLDEMRTLNDYAGAVRTENINLPKISEVFDQMKCEPNQLERLAIPMSEITTRWVLSSNRENSGDITVNIFRGELRRLEKDYVTAVGTGPPVFTFTTNKLSCLVG
jgi:hypothetical protein